MYYKGHGKVKVDIMLLFIANKGWTRSFVVGYWLFYFSSVNLTQMRKKRPLQVKDYLKLVCMLPYLPLPLLGTVNFVTVGGPAQKILPKKIHSGGRPKFSKHSKGQKTDRRWTKWGSFFNNSIIALPDGRHFDGNLQPHWWINFNVAWWSPFFVVVVAVCETLQKHSKTHYLGACVSQRQRWWQNHRACSAHP